jgi:hypothetical protein
MSSAGAEWCTSSRIEVLVQDVVDDVGDVSRQPDTRPGQVHSLTDTGQARRVGLMSRRPQIPPHEVKPMGAGPGSMYEHEHRDASDTRSSRSRGPRR